MESHIFANGWNVKWKNKSERENCSVRRTDFATSTVDIDFVTSEQFEVKTHWGRQFRCVARKMTTNECGHSNVALPIKCYHLDKEKRFLFLIFWAITKEQTTGNFSTLKTDSPTLICMPRVSHSCVCVCTCTCKHIFRGSTEMIYIKSVFVYFVSK